MVGSRAELAKVRIWELSSPPAVLRKIKGLVVGTKRKVSILILTHNAIRYVYQTLNSIRCLTTGVDYEVVVVDNDSRMGLKLLLTWLLRRGWIDRLRLLDHNSLFSKGNNIAARLADSHSTHLLLLNSDVEVRNPDWLTRLLDSHQGGMTSYGVVRVGKVGHQGTFYVADGYCVLIDRKLYQKYMLDEAYEWWWSVTRLQAQLLTDGYLVKAYNEHEKYLHHFGGKSGRGYKSAKSMDLGLDEVADWFHGRSVTVIESAP